MTLHHFMEYIYLKPAGQSEMPPLPACVHHIVEVQEIKDLGSTLHGRYMYSVINVGNYGTRCY